MLFQSLKLMILLGITLIIGFLLGNFFGKAMFVGCKPLPFISNAALKNNDQADCRKNLTKILDATQIPHGDLVIPSQVVHSGRYLVSQWQRAAVGATVIVLGIDAEKDLCVALGKQQGYFKHPQGYMEIPLPKADLTHLREQGASRINGKTGKVVKADISIEENATREVYEEIGLKVSPQDLTLLSISSLIEDSPVTIAANYLLFRLNTPPLKAIDNEFADDLQEPRWFKVKNIYFNKGKFYVKNESTEVDPRTVKVLHQALVKLNEKQPQYASLISGLINFNQMPI